MNTKSIICDSRLLKVSHEKGLKIRMALHTKMGLSFDELKRYKKDPEVPQQWQVEGGMVLRRIANEYPHSNKVEVM